MGFLSQTQPPRTDVRWSYHCLTIRRCPSEEYYSPPAHPCRGAVRNADTPTDGHAVTTYHSYTHTCITCLTGSNGQSYAPYIRTSLPLRKVFPRIYRDPGHASSYPITVTYLQGSNPHSLSLPFGKVYVIILLTQSVGKFPLKIRASVDNILVTATQGKSYSFLMPATIHTT